MGDIQYWTDYFPIDGPFSGMMNLPDFGEEPPEDAARSLIDLLQDGAEIVLCGGTGITVTSDIPGIRYQSTSFSGDVADMEPLRRIVLLYLSGHDLKSIRLFLLPDWRFANALAHSSKSLIEA